MLRGSPRGAPRALLLGRFLGEEWRKHQAGHPGFAQLLGAFSLNNTLTSFPKDGACLHGAVHPSKNPRSSPGSCLISIFNRRKLET